MKTLAIDPDPRIRIVDHDGRPYFDVLSGGVHEHEIVVGLQWSEAHTLMSDPTKRRRLARLIVRKPSVFEERRVRDLALP